VFDHRVNSAELVRQGDGANWFVWFASVADPSFVRSATAIPTSDLDDDIGANPSTEQIIDYIEQRLRDAGYHVARREHIPNFPMMVAMFDLR